MEDLTKEIASIFQNETFSFQNTKELLRLITQQNNNLFDLKFLGNSDFSLLLKARKNGGKDIAIKVVKYDANLAGIQTAKREYELLQDGIISNYFIKVYDQYYLNALSDKQRKTNEDNLSQSKFFVQELELCSGNLKDLLTQFREKKENPSDIFKEILAIQMLDALNLLHSRGLIHRNIKPSNFLVSQNNNSENSPIILKLSDIGFVSPWKKSKLRKSSEHLVYLAPETQDQHCLIESDLFSLGMILLELDNAVTFDASKVIPEELQQLKQGKIFENKNINRSSFLYEIAKTFLKPSPQNRESAHEMLWKLLNKSKEYQKIPIFSIFFKNQLKPQKPISQANQQILDDSKTHLTTELIQSALEHMLEWEDFEGNFDLISQDSYGVVFGARNLKHNRNCVLKLSICLNKAEEMRKIMVRKMSLTPYFVGFYGYRFFQNTHKTHEFVVLELERCRYSLTNYLENQRIEGELLKAQKEHLAAQMIDAVNFLHQNQISQINLTLDSFLVTQEDNELGQVIVKLSRFSQGTMDDYLKIDEKAMINPLQEYLQTKQSDYFELGQCLLFLDNYPNLPDYLFTSKGSLISPQYYSKQYLPFSKSSSLSFINKSTSIYDLARQLHNYSIKSPNILNKPIQNLKNICPVYSEILQYPFQEHPLHQSISFNLINISNNFHQNCLKSLSNFKNLKYLSLNLESKSIKQREAQSLLSSLENLSNLQTLSLNLKANQIGSEGASYLLSPLAHLISLNCFSIDLSYNQIGIVGAQFLLLPISHLVNISKLSLNLQLNDIRAEGTDYLLQPLNNLINLQALSLNLQWNKINQDDLQYVY